MVSVRCFGVKVSVMFHTMFVFYTFSSVWVADEAMKMKCLLKDTTSCLW